MAEHTRTHGDQIRVALVARSERGVTGTSRYVTQLLAELRSLSVAVSLLSSSPAPSALSRAGRQVGVDLTTFFGHYPCRLPAMRAVPCDVIHLATQNLATLLVFHRFPRPVVVTVHDIIPYLARHDRRFSSYGHALHRLFDTIAMRGLQQADLLLADSAWTKDTLRRELAIAPDRIRVVYPGVDTARFRPLDVPAGFWGRYGLEQGNRYLLYVGSDDPRKNLPTLLRAFGRVGRECHDLRLLKVGAPRQPSERRRLNDLATELGIAAKVRWISHVPEEDLPLFYNAAVLLVMPSLYEGFGLPILESLACGTRVVCSNTGALPEVAGYDCVRCPPTAEALADALATTLAQEPAQTAREGRRRTAEQFPWTDTAKQVRDLYSQIGKGIARVKGAALR